MKKIIVITFCCIFLLLSGGDAEAGCDKGRRLYEDAMSQRDASGRIILLKQSLAECEDFNAYYELAKACKKEGHLEEAEKTLLDAKDVAKDNTVFAKLLFQLGVVYGKMGKTNEAYTCFQESYEKDPRPVVRKNIRAIEVYRMKQGIMRAEDIKKSLVSSKNVSKGFRGFVAESSVNLHINFEYDKSRLNASGRKQSDELGRALADPIFRDSSFTLIGHTDTRGDNAYNLRLSEKRANAVREYLIKHYSLSSRRIRTEGRGEQEPLYPEDTEEDCILNRRVEVRLN